LTEKAKGHSLKKNKGEIVRITIIVLLCAAMAVLDFLPVTYTKNEVNNRLLSDTVPLMVGSVAVVWLMIRGKTKLFGKPTKLLFLIPCLLIAVDNFPFHAYFAGKGEILHTGLDNWLLFALYCACVGIFEEFVFRGILFPLMAGSFTPDKKGFLKTFFFSSIVFGGMHIFNIFVGGGIGPTLLQVCYSTLIGGLCAFVLVKTKNILLCAFVHGLYDFCGMLLSESPGLGGGVPYDWQTVIIMAVIGIAVGLFVLYFIWKYPESERKELYDKLGFGVRADPTASADVTAGDDASRVKSDSEKVSPENGDKNK
jgi:putative membrane protein